MQRNGDGSCFNEDDGRRDKSAWVKYLITKKSILWKKAKDREGMRNQGWANINWNELCSLRNEIRL